MQGVDPRFEWTRFILQRQIKVTPKGAVNALVLAVTLAVVPLAVASCSTSQNTPAAQRSPLLAWVATGSYISEPGDTITPVNTATALPGRPLGTGRLPSAMAITPNGQELLVTNSGDDTLAVVDLATRRVSARIRVGLEPDSVAVEPAHSGSPPIAVVANFGANTVSFVNLQTLRVGKSVPAGNQPDAVAIAPGGPRNSGVALVADYGSAQVTPIDLATMQPQPAIAVGAEPDAIAVYGSHSSSPAFSPTSPQSTPGAGNVALVANFGANTISPISLSSYTTSAQIGLPGDPTAIAIAPTGTAWVSNSGYITPIHISTLSVGTSIALSGVAEGLAITPNGHTAWVTLQNGVVTSLALSSGTIVHNVAVGGRPSAVIVAG